MADRSGEDSTDTPRQVPRDMQDQQTYESGTSDPWDTAEGRNQDPDDQRQEAGEEPDEGIPETDESGTGRRGAQQSGTVHPEHPEPDESPG